MRAPRQTVNAIEAAGNMKLLSGLMRHAKQRAGERERARALYIAAVEQARRPGFYTDCGVADSVDGRFDLIVLHVFLVIRALRRAAEPGKRLSDLIFKIMMDDMDMNLREMGVGGPRRGAGMRADHAALLSGGRGAGPPGHSRRMGNVRPHPAGLASVQGPRAYRAAAGGGAGQAGLVGRGVPGVGHPHSLWTIRVSWRAVSMCTWTKPETPGYGWMIRSSRSSWSPDGWFQGPPLMKLLPGSHGRSRPT